ncbi:MAG: DUF4012 domain-containing protein [Candidatus Roizmanbacteria bacterium]
MRRKKRTGLKIFFGILAFLFVIVCVIGVVGYFNVVVPILKIKSKADILVASGKTLREVFKKNDIDLVKKEVAKIQSQYQDFANESKLIYWATSIPQVKDYKNAVEAGDYLLKATTVSIDAIYPYADLIGLKKGQTNFLEKSAEDRLQTAVATLEKVLVKVDDIAGYITEAEKRIDSIDPDRYPEKIGGRNVRSEIVNAKEGFRGIVALFVDAKPIVKNLPKILGANGKEKTYLIIFQNEKEARATGGFLTAYAIFKIKDGRMAIERSSDIYNLDASIEPNHPSAPEKIRTYHINVPKFWIRDSNISPDFVESMKLFNSLYEKSRDRVAYDGVFAMDSKILVDMLTIYGDIEAGGVRFSAKQDTRCDCPQVIYQLFDLVGRPVGYIKENRKGILGVLMYELFQKALKSSPSRYWGVMFQAMFLNLQEKHILLNFNDPVIQQSVEKMNFGGLISQVQNIDYLHVNNVNFAGAKSDLFVSENIISTTSFEGNVINREVKVEYKNPYPQSDCSLLRSSLCLNAPRRTWIRIYVPKGSKLIGFTGSQMKVQTYDELGKTVFEGFTVVPTQGRTEIDVKYSLPSTLSKSNYSLMIQKQPGKDKQQLSVTIDTKKVYSGNFLIDKTVK